MIYGQLLLIVGAKCTNQFNIATSKLDYCDDVQGGYSHGNPM